jgi:hypothetical protein
VKHTALPIAGTGQNSEKLKVHPNTNNKLQGAVQKKVRVVAGMSEQNGRKAKKGQGKIWVNLEIKLGETRENILII